MKIVTIIYCTKFEEVENELMAARSRLPNKLKGPGKMRELDECLDFELVDNYQRALDVFSGPTVANERSWSYFDRAIEPWFL